MPAAQRDKFLAAVHSALLPLRDVTVDVGALRAFVEESWPLIAQEENADPWNWALTFLERKRDAGAY